MATEAALEIKPKKRLKKLFFLLIIALAVLLLAVGFWWWRGRRDQAYITLPVNRGSIVNTISASGMVEAVKSVGLNFESSGIIKEVHVQPGDRVKAGQLLARLDSTDQEAELAQARANLEISQAKLSLLQAPAEESDIVQAEASVTQAQVAFSSAEENLKSNQVLYDSGVLAKVDLDNSVAERDTAAAKLRQAQASLDTLLKGSRPEDIASARAQVDIARVQLQLAQKSVAGTELRAPWDGIISDVQGVVGQRAGGGGSDDNQGFITMITPQLQLRAQVNEADIGEIEIGQAATFTVNAFPEGSFKGRVNWISPVAATVSNVQLYDVVISITDPDLQLKAGMSASVNIIVDQRDNVITAPRSAVTFAASHRSAGGGQLAAQTGRVATRGAGADGTGTRGGDKAKPELTAPDTGKGKTEQEADNAGNGRQAAVLVLEKGRPVARQIVTGLSDERNIEIKSGLKLGEQVIIGASGSGTQTTNGASTFRTQQPMNFMQGR